MSENEVTAEVTEFVITAEEVKPEDVGTLSLRYVDGVAQLVVSGGAVVPATLAVVDGDGKAVAAYTAGSVSAPARMSGRVGESVYIAME
ncbi:hypothetical protein ACFUJR_01095 [Streptomyces sp. NPDC057271]|uniref:hypothetical protein n=1 Tax=unclassified Streptomyces TaxID=2593676 RepID=UPI00362D7510